MVRIERTMSQDQVSAGIGSNYVRSKTISEMDTVKINGSLMQKAALQQLGMSG